MSIERYANFQEQDRFKTPSAAVVRDRSNLVVIHHHGDPLADIRRGNARGATDDNAVAAYTQ